jgi:type I restriction enzyme R subunit
MLFRECEEQVDSRQLSDLPDKFNGNRHAQAYFGVFKKQLPETFSVLDEQNQNKWIELCFDIDKSVENSVAENSINPQNIETDIRKKLLPTIFKECKAVGAGMDQAKAIVEMIVQITRVGLMH